MNIREPPRLINQQRKSHHIIIHHSSKKVGRKALYMGRFISLMIFLVEYLLMINVLLSATAHGSAAPNVQQLNIVNRNIGFELEQGILPSIIADAPAGSNTPEPSETTTTAEGPDIRRMGKEHLHHHSSDKSEAGGGLIIGGLATAIFAAVFCYIRVTRKSSSSSTDEHMGSNSSSTMAAVRESTRTDGTTSAASSSSTI